jgi:hypothetical protein
LRQPSEEKAKELLNLLVGADPTSGVTATGAKTSKSTKSAKSAAPSTTAPNARISKVTSLESSVNSKGQFGRSTAILGTRALIGAPNGDVQDNPLGVAYYFSNVSSKDTK